MVHSLIGMLTDANDQLPIYIEDLKQAKCIEPFEVSSKQDDDDKHFLFWFFIEKLCEEVRHEEAYPILKRLITQFNSLLAEAEIAKLNCDPVVFKEFFLRKKEEFNFENVVIRFYRKLHRIQPVTFDKLKKLELEVVIKALNQGIFDFAEKPSKTSCPAILRSRIRFCRDTPNSDSLLRSGDTCWCSTMSDMDCMWLTISISSTMTRFALFLNWM